MINIPIKLKIRLFLLFILINTFVYIITDASKKNKIDDILSGNLKMLNAHYQILLETEHRTANGIYKSTLAIHRVSEIMEEANKASKLKKAKLRDELHKLLKIKYRIAKENGVFQYHFILANNESFYRAHKVEKFGDDLTNIRADIKHIAKIQKPVSSFEQGKTAHAFRNLFPLFNKNNIYIGAIEVSFTSNDLQWYLNTISNIHSHFIVDKEIFKAKAWKSNDLSLIYVQSAESENYMFNLSNIHTKEICVFENQIKLKPIKAEIDSNISKGKGFSSYVNHYGHFDVMTFLPVPNTNKEVAAWIVSYMQSDTIKTAMKSSLIIRIISFIISLLIVYLLLKQIQSKKESEKQHKLLNNILNQTDNIMFITDFKDIKYSNNKFNSLINMKDINMFNKEQKHNILNIFLHTDGYLHSGLLKSKEDFISLISRTEKKDRIVSILDKKFEEKAFMISLSKTENKDYLVSLFDVTKMKEHQLKTEKKAYIDGLTNVYNRNKFDEIFKSELKYSQRYKTPLSVAILDIDKFKNFNDDYGHLIGDEVLITMAQTVNSSVRETDTFARWGGEEFVILFKNTNATTAKAISEKIRKKIQENKHPIAGKITASFGITEYKSEDTAQSIFKRCDKALYLAKEKGRNIVEVL